ncbi:hypothetical protein [Humibacter ginsenosidimutans]|uniref:Uncharacterized protein n=1 Tax=Humibacter ginsenosidimutans TaxID=2599293 RepID=A0A5B8M1M6_9MICO|nr:hypothetical protein [Humibacter ginsenosidimutans]QDZ14243.1 hypothetical protein FPZ11_05210 [Humibacter ginsenosidimutans]
MADWYTLETIRAQWREAPSNDDVLQQVLDASKASVLVYDNGWSWRRDPSLSVDGDGNTIDFPGDYPEGKVPSSLVMGQRAQARNLWNANRVNPQNGDVGTDTFTLQPFPLDWVIKQIIRPKSPFGSFG